MNVCASSGFRKEGKQREVVVDSENLKSRKRGVSPLRLCQGPGSLCDLGDRRDVCLEPLVCSKV